MILQSLLLCFFITSVTSQETDNNTLIEQVFGKDPPNPDNGTSISEDKDNTTREGDECTSSPDSQSTDIETLIKEIFCGKDPANIDKEKENKPREVIDEDGDECTCVPFYLCPNGTVSTDGEGILDIKVKGICEDYMDKCCKVPIDPTLQPKPKKRAGCGQRNPEGVGFRIIGDKNHEAQFGEFPWMVALLKRSVSDDGTDLMVYQCGGAIIHESVVLTAAHCVTKKQENNSELYVRAGEWDTQRTTEIFPHENRKVVQTIVYPGFQRRNVWNDFAILVLEKPLTLGENIDIVCLPAPGEVPLSRECFASGWGKDHFGQKGQYQVILKKIDLPIVPKNQCLDLLRKTRLGPYFKLHESFVCAGGIVGKDTCKGDGGSPLVCPIEGKPGIYEVTGLVAWGIGCGDETPGVYAGVAYARKWIDETMEKLKFPIK